jgi:hypothetical protein
MSYKWCNLLLLLLLLLMMMMLLLLVVMVMETTVMMLRHATATARATNAGYHVDGYLYLMKDGNGWRCIRTRISLGRNVIACWR